MLRCGRCEKEFEKPKKAGAGRPPKFCSDACRHEARKENWRRVAKVRAQKEKQARHAESRNCAYCKSEFTLTTGKTFYCTDACARKATSKNKNAARRAALSNVDYESPVSPADLALRDGPNCCHCKQLFDFEIIGVVDHIIPLSRGGVHAGYNCQLLCEDCNHSKHNKIPAIDLQKALRLWPQKPNITERDPRRNILARKIRPNSGYRGVIQHRDKWRCKIEFEGHVFRKGGFDTAEDAARQYNHFCALLGLGPEYQNDV